MGVTLVDLKDEERKECVNWWNWRPTIEIIRSIRLIDDERLEWMGCNGGSGPVTEEEARQIGHFLEKEILPRISPGERVLLDGTVMSKPDDGTFYREPNEVHKNYSANYEWLKTFAAFCKTCGGFEVY